MQGNVLQISDKEDSWRLKKKKKKKIKSQKLRVFVSIIKAG